LKFAKSAKFSTTCQMLLYF